MDTSYKMISIKEINEKDIDLCYELDSNTLSLWSKKQWASEFKKEGIKVFGLLLANLVIGICVFQVVLDEAQINFFVVNKKFRKKGYGSYFMSYLIEQCEEINVDFYKTLSWNINSFDFLDKLVNTGKKIFVSTGTSSTDKIDKLQNRYRGENITLIHTQLQFEVENVNLLAIDFLRDRYDFPIAFGNHCENTDVLYTSVAFKPSDIFFYVKGDKRIEHIDEKHSVRLSKVNDTVNSLMELSKSLGVPNKFDVEIEDKSLILNTKDKK